MEIERDYYLKELVDRIDNQLIKIVTGIRRCGKSTLFDLYCDYLISEGISEEQIIRINLEDADFSFITNYKELYEKEQLRVEELTKEVNDLKVKLEKITEILKEQ